MEQSLSFLRQSRQDGTAAQIKGIPAGPEHPVTREEALGPLRNLVGLRGVRKVLDELYSYMAVQAMRKKVHLASDTSVMHMVFLGQPGTGKTTVARLIGRMFHSFGALPSGHVVEVERADLVGEYVGHTAQKTREKIERADGGVLFIDEAYALARGGERDFGREAVDTLVKALEDRRSEMVVVLAGYEEEMRSFLSLNPGLHSRFPLQITFPDFSERELLQIAGMMVRARDYRLSTDAYVVLRQLLRKEREQLSFANARTVRNLVERALRRHAARAIRIQRPTREDLSTLIAADFRDDDSSPEPAG